MPQLIQYRVADGMIISICESYSLELLAQNRHEEDPAYAYLERQEHLPLMEQERYEIRDGAVHAKQQIAIEADPLTFHADGIDECLVTVEPWHPCVLLVNGVAYPLTEDEPMLLITSDVPQTFTIVLAPMAGFWALPLQVEAIADAKA